MKKQACLLGIMLGLSTAAPAQNILVSVNPNIIIPDGDLNGIQSSQTLTGLPAGVTHVSLSLNITGGFNGDFYAYLYHNNSRQT